MKEFLTEGAAEVVGGVGAAVKLFWPVAFGYLAIVLIFAAAGFFTRLDSMAATVALLLSGVTGAVYIFLALCQGAVGWHRRVLLNETPGWISPIPRRRSLKYALAVLAFAIIFLIGHVVISSYTRPYLHSIFTSPLGNIDLTHAPVEVLERWRMAVFFPISPYARLNRTMARSRMASIIPQGWSARCSSSISCLPCWGRSTP